MGTFVIILVEMKGKMLRMQYIKFRKNIIFQKHGISLVNTLNVVVIYPSCRAEMLISIGNRRGNPITQLK